VFFLDQEYSGLYNDEVWECIGCNLNLPETPHPHQNLLNYTHICKFQQQDKQMLALQVKHPDNHVNLQLDDDANYIICYRKILLNPIGKLCCPNQW
jgi:hypothetical protein